MARADGNHALEELYRLLRNQQFDFIPRGEHHVSLVYKTVKELYSDFCDDSYLCSTSCKRGAKSAEWKHVVSAVLKKVKSRGGPVSEGHAKRYWLFGNVDAPMRTEKEIIEGRWLMRMHKIRERSPKIVRRKKLSVFEKTGRLDCEACGFDFAVDYGELGHRFAECHHRLPLADHEEEMPTLLEDLAIVCANCHRMLHRNQPMMKVEDLRSLVLQRRAARSAAEQSATPDRNRGTDSCL